MEQRNEIIFTLACPKCNQALPQALKRKELLETVEVNCPSGCKWKYPRTCEEDGKLIEKWFFLAKDATVKEQSIEEWFGPNYQPGVPGFYSREELETVLEQDIKDGRVNLDEVFKHKNK